MYCCFTASGLSEFFLVTSCWRDIILRYVFDIMDGERKKTPYYLWVTWKNLSKERSPSKYTINCLSKLHPQLLPPSLTLHAWPLPSNPITKPIITSDLLTPAVSVLWLAAAQRTTSFVLTVTLIRSITHCMKLETDEWMCGCVDGWMDTVVEGLESIMDRWIQGWMDNCWVEGWME